ncbi:GNAT family N-acetyltransferase [Paracoccus kondratievae]|uniref:GNAT family N-acetyltransferase n=1 Tax=Paracoccus kondratievae TaxID=135740 RepID=UPI001266394F|nr:GNAT family N-acetyltransferase [Paracoccus kondratievae]QFQ89370.1 GNAT family N-acetyltransferase [Paracoccus kondratievae]
MPASTASISLADNSDLDWLIRQHETIYAKEFGFGPSFRDSTAEKVAAFIKNSTDFSRIWIAGTDGQRAASIAISERPERSAFLNFVLVLPAFRGHGLARRMVATALTHARNHDMTEVRLETYDCLQEARRLYARLGFELTEATPGVIACGQTFTREFWALKL